MMRDSSGGDYAATVIPITRSMIFWEPSEVCKWLEHLEFDAQVRRYSQTGQALRSRKRLQCTTHVLLERVHEPHGSCHGMLGSFAAVVAYGKSLQSRQSSPFSTGTGQQEWTAGAPTVRCTGSYKFLQFPCFGVTSLARLEGDHATRYQSSMRAREPFIRVHVAHGW